MALIYIQIHFYGKNGEGFFDWYSEKYGITKYSNWYFTMLEQSGNSEEKAIDYFFSLLEEFCKDKRIDIPQKIKKN